jgi:hypothetical protein
MTVLNADLEFLTVANSATLSSAATNYNALTSSDASGLDTASRLNVEPNASGTTIRSIVLSSSQPGRTIFVQNTGTSAGQTLTLPNEDGSGTANWRFFSPQGNAYVLPPGAGVTICLDDTISPTSWVIRSGLSAGNVSGLAAIATSGSASDLVAGTVPAARMPALTGDITSSAGSTATTIANGVVSNAKLANMPANTFKANNTGSSAAPSDITIAQVLALTNIGLGQFCDASDGSATMDGSASVPGYSLAGSTYTATREAYFQDLTINSGITVDQRTYPGPNVRGTLTNNGHLSWDGASASGQTAGTFSTAGGPLPVGGSGGNGGAVNSVGSPGGGSAQAPRGLSTTAAAGGTGGAPPTNGTAGGTGHGGGGGAALANGGFGGGITTTPTQNGDWHSLNVASYGVCTASGSTLKMTGCSGGGGGAGGGGTGVGGGGGASGCWAVLRVFHFNSAATGTFTNNGGNGANGAPASTGVNQAGGAGGGGGAGGIMVVVTADPTSSLPTFSVAGGSPGTGAAGTGTGATGSNGGAGGSGLVLIFN